VDGGDHEIELIEHLVRKVQRAVGQNVRLDAFEDPEILPEALVQPVGFPVLLCDLLDRRTTSIVRGLRMVGDSEKFESTLAGRIFSRVSVPSEASVWQ
jgi:hypothetical protein